MLTSSISYLVGLMEKCVYAGRSPCFKKFDVEAALASTLGEVL